MTLGPCVCCMCVHSVPELMCNVCAVGTELARAWDMHVNVWTCVHACSECEHTNLQTGRCRVGVYSRLALGGPCCLDIPVGEKQDTYTMVRHGKASRW